MSIKRDKAKVDRIFADHVDTDFGTENDEFVIRIPRSFTFDVPESISVDIPPWMFKAVGAAVAIMALHAVTGGAIWHCWWLIFFVQPFFFGKMGKKHGFMWACHAPRQVRSQTDYPHDVEQTHLI